MVGAPPPSARTRRTVLGSHGSGAWNGHFISDLASAAGALARSDISPWATIGEALRGSITLYVWDSHEQEVAILPDPLGAGLSFIYRDDDFSAISSDHRALARFVVARGMPLTKSADYVASLLLTGAGGVFPSSYKEIDAVPNFNYVVASSDGLKLQEYGGALERTLRPESPIEDLIDQGYWEIRDNSQAAIKSSHGFKYVHLTGGRDSRMVLGSLLALREASSFEYYSIKGQKADYDIAAGLAGSYGLRLTDDLGFSPGSVETYDELLYDTMASTGGLLPSGARTNMNSSGPLVLSGGYGECFRTFKSKNMARSIMAADVHAFPQMMWEGRGYAKAGPTIFTNEFLERVAISVRAKARKGLDLGVAPRNVADYFYLSVRNRYWVGLQSRTWSEFGARFDPLYSLGAIAAAARHEFQQRRSNLVGFDLMARFDPKLLRYPFKSPVFDGVYAEHREVPDSLSFENVAPAPAPTPGRSVRGGRGSQRALLPRPSSEQIVLARRLDVPIGRVVAFDYIRPKLANMIGSASSPVSELQDALDLERVVRHILEDPTRASVQQGISLYSALLWMSTPPGSD